MNCRFSITSITNGDQTLTKISRHPVVGICNKHIAQQGGTTFSHMHRIDESARGINEAGSSHKAAVQQNRESEKATNTDYQQE